MEAELPTCPIDEILNDVVARIRLGESISISDLCRLHPEHASELQLLVPAIQLLEAPSTAPSKRVQGSNALPPSSLELSDYQIVREIGRGAMGVVYLAKQVSLARWVALKVIPISLNNAAQLARFRRESATVAGLQHPNIVAVYDYGETKDSAYYAMQFIEGWTLHQIIHSSDTSLVAHGAVSNMARMDDSTRKRSMLKTAGAQESSSLAANQAAERTDDVAPSGQILTPRRIAGICRQLADALAHAHQHGVLHRDIKPSNLLLDREGRAFIADFGLAWHPQAEDLTASGEIVGTLRYMAPESFEGRQDELSDVYGLGMTLYELLEGRPAFTQLDRASLVKQILAGAIRPFSRHVPRDLQTICVKSLQLFPKDRYSSAKQFADDLQRFGSDEPIAARPLNTLQKATRWCLRNRLASSLLIIALASASLGSGAYWVLSQRVKESDATSAKNFSAAARNLDLLFKTIDQFCLKVGESRRLYRPEFAELRQQLHKASLELGEQLDSHSGLSVEARMQLAAIYQRLGTLRQPEDKLSDSAQYLDQAIKLLNGLQPADLQSSRAQLSLAVCHRELGGIQNREGMQTAFLNIDQAISIANKLLEVYAEDETIVHRASLEKSRALRFLAFQQFHTGDIERAEALVREASVLLENARLKTHDDLELNLELAEQHASLAQFLTANLKRFKIAGEPLLRADALYRESLEKYDDMPDVEFNRAILQSRLARWRFVSGEFELAVKEQSRSVQGIQKLVDNFSDEPTYCAELGLALRQLFDYRFAIDKKDPNIEKLLEQSRTILEGLVQQHPSDQPLASKLEKTLASQAQYLFSDRRFAEALVSVERAIYIQKAVLKQSPNNTQVADSHYFAIVNKAECLTELARFPEAIQVWDTAQKLAPAIFADRAQLGRARTLALADRIEDAFALTESIVTKKFERKSGARRLFLQGARVYAIGSKKSLSENGESTPESERLAARSVELLLDFAELDNSTEAKAKGQSAANPENIKAIKEYKEFEVLRSRPDFLKLLGE